MIHLYDSPVSGNGYKVRLLMNQLEIPFTSEEFSVFGDRDRDRGPEFFAKNPVGKIPTIVLDSGESLGESLAILCYLAEGTPFLPDHKLERARVLSWMSFEQNNLEPTLATARYVVGMCKAQPHEEVLAGWISGGNRVLGILEKHLGQQEWLANGRYSLADIACFAYTHVCEEGPFKLEPYPAVRAWLDRVRATPGFVPMS